LPAGEPACGALRGVGGAAGDTFRHRRATSLSDGQKELLHMRMRNLWMWTAAAALAAGTLPAAAGPLFSWTAEDGTVSYTDDAKRIPERYRAVAKEVPGQALRSYGRYSPAKPEAETQYAEQLDKRLARLRALNRALAQEGAYADGGYAAPGARVDGPELLVSVDRDTSVRVPTASAAAGDAPPVVVEDVRVRRSGSAFTVHDTVIRQGDRVLMVVRGDQHNFDISNDIREEDSLLREGFWYDDRYHDHERY
jgi:hypothetical protein